jgi:hypothetical protein
LYLFQKSQKKVNLCWQQRLTPVSAAQGGSLALVSPAHARQQLRQQPAAASALDRAAVLPALLAYCLADVDPSAATAVQQLAGLPLLPLVNGALAAFAAAAALAGDAAQRGATLYVTTDLELRILASTGAHLCGGAGKEAPGSAGPLPGVLQHGALCEQAVPPHLAQLS